MEIALLGQQQTPSIKDLEVLGELVERFGLDTIALIALIDAFNYGVIKGKQAERNNKEA